MNNKLCIDFDVRKYIISAFLIYLCQRVLFIWLDPNLVLAQNIFEILSYIKIFGISYLSMIGGSTVITYLIIMLLCIITGLSLLMIPKYYICKKELKASVIFYIKHFFKIWLLTFIELTLIIISLALFILPGIYMYLKLSKLNFLFIEDPSKRIPELFYEAFNNYSFSKLYMLIVPMIIFVLLSFFRILIFYGNLLDDSMWFFRLENLGLHGVYYLVLPLWYDCIRHVHVLKP